MSYILAIINYFSMNSLLRNRMNGNSSNTRIHYRRGIANVVSSAILLSAVSIMGAMLLGWSQSSMNEQKIEMNDVFDTQLNKIREDLIFENIWFATPAGMMPQNHLNVTVANIGILGLNVTEIHVTENNNEEFIYPVANGGIPKSDSFSVNVTYPWQSDDELDVIVFTNRGNQFLSQVIAP